MKIFASAIILLSLCLSSNIIAAEKCEVNQMGCTPAKSEQKAKEPIAPEKKDAPAAEKAKPVESNK